MVVLAETFWWCVHRVPNNLPAEQYQQIDELDQQNDILHMGRTMAESACVTSAERCATRFVFARPGFDAGAETGLP
jgi:hypothetical protein